MPDEPATTDDLDPVLQLLLQLTEGMTGLTVLVARLVQLQLRGIEYTERRQPPAEPPARFTIDGESAEVERALHAATDAARLLNDLIEKRRR